jgi:hypothetical protein
MHSTARGDKQGPDAKTSGGGPANRARRDPADGLQARAARPSDRQTRRQEKVWTGRHNRDRPQRRDGNRSAVRAMRTLSITSAYVSSPIGPAEAGPNRVLHPARAGCIFRQIERCRRGRRPRLRAHRARLQRSNRSGAPGSGDCVQRRRARGSMRTPPNRSRAGASGCRERLFCRFGSYSDSCWRLV